MLTAYSSYSTLASLFKRLLLKLTLNGVNAEFDLIESSSHDMKLIHRSEKAIASLNQPLQCFLCS